MYCYFCLQMSRVHTTVYVLVAVCVALAVRGVSASEGDESAEFIGCQMSCHAACDGQLWTRV